MQAIEKVVKSLKSAEETLEGLVFDERIPEEFEGEAEEVRVELGNLIQRLEILVRK